MNEIEQKAVEEMYQEFLQYKHDTMCKVFSYKGMCENFINLGYRKIDEDSVMLTKERYNYLTVWFNKFAEIMNDVEKQTRKETARDILQIIKREYDYIGNLERIIAKEYGVEVE